MIRMMAMMTTKMIPMTRMVDDLVWDVNTGDCSVTHVVQVTGQGAVTASDLQDLICGLAVLVKYPAQVMVLSVPLERFLSTLLEETVPIFLLMEFF